MKSDPTASSFFIKMMQQNRMDQTLAGGRKPSATQGSGSEGSDEAVSFKAVYNKVAKTNTAAQKITDEHIASKESKKIDRENSIDSSTPVVPYAIDPADHFKAASPIVESNGTDAVDGVKGDDNETTTDASKIISDALAAISEKLNISTDPALKQLSITTVTKDTVQQLSEIVVSLKNIAGLLNIAAAGNQKIDLGASGVLDVSQERDLGAFIQSQLFKIEIGIGMLGAGEQVQEMVGQELPQSGGTIPQATDPAQLSMSLAHTQKIFGDLFQGPSTDLTLLAQKIRELCSEDGQVPTGAVSLNIVSGKAPAEDGAPFLFDAQTMRAMLKIDGKNGVAEQNVSAAQNEKINLLPGDVSILAKDGAALNSPLEQMSLVDGTTKDPGGIIVTAPEANVPAPTYKTLDESVMQQLADKMQTAYRTGVNEIRIQLRPESLGDVKLNIRVEGDVVYAKIQVESQHIKQIVESNMQFLKDSLSQQHLQMGSLDVNVGSDGSRGQGDREVYGAEGSKPVTGGSEAGDVPMATDAKQLTIGNETGRRFGENSVEYFA
jgi:flagellar hook-length control protein FliK